MVISVSVRASRSAIVAYFGGNIWFSRSMYRVSAVASTTWMPGGSVDRSRMPGPAGLTAAYLLCKQEVPVIVLEADPTYVGGISRTVYVPATSPPRL